MRRTVEVTDMDAAQQILSDTYALMRIDSNGDRRGMRLRSEPLGGIRLDQVSFGMAFRAEVSPLHAYVFGEVTSGRARYSSDGEERDHLPGDVALTAQPDHPYAALIDDTAADFAVIAAERFAEVAAPPPGRGDAVAFAGYRPVSARAAAGWKAVHSFLRNEVLANPDTADSPLVAGHAARLLVATTLATFPNTSLVEPTATDRNDAHPRTLRRAVAFIEANPHRDIGVADIARAASVSIRAIQLAFRRHLDTTPSGYLRRVRLECARRELLRESATDGGSTVTAVAARWGYARPGRFAARYRVALGETPSATLRGR